MEKRKTTQEEKEIFEFLNELRESGEINMCCARPYIIKEFGVDSKKAGEYLSTWMKVFNKEGVYHEITI